MLKPRIQIDTRSRADFANTVRRSQRPAAQRELNALGREWADVANQLAVQDTEAREGRRHKGESASISQGPFQHELKLGGDDGFPMMLSLTLKPGVSKKKMAALIFGVDHEYEIRVRRAKYLRWGSAPGDLHKPFQKSVIWKPTGRIRQGYGWMLRARSVVMARRHGLG